MNSEGTDTPIVERAELRPGYSISRVIKGGWQLAGGHGGFDRTEAVADMEKFVRAGITTFDCADIYTGVEQMIGDAISSMRDSAMADNVQVHTKLVPDLDKLALLTQQDVETIIDRSLKRLQIEQLQLVQFYWWDLSIGDPLASFDVLKRLRDTGKIKHLGCTNWDQAAMQAFADNDFDLVSAQVQYSLLDARPANAFSSWCQQHNIKLLCYGVLAGGFLTPYWLGKPDPGFEFENRSLVKYRLIIEDFGGWDLFQALLETLNQIATSKNPLGRSGTEQSGAGKIELSTVAIRYMLDQPQVAAVIIGARTARHLDQTLSVFSFSLAEADKQMIQGVLADSPGIDGPVYGLERDRNGPHGRIMKYNLGGE